MKERNIRSTMKKAFREYTSVMVHCDQVPGVRAKSTPAAMPHKELTSVGTVRPYFSRAGMMCILCSSSFSSSKKSSPAFVMIRVIKPAAKAPVKADQRFTL